MECRSPYGFIYLSGVFFMFSVLQLTSVDDKNAGFSNKCASNERSQKKTKWGRQKIIKSVHQICNLPHGIWGAFSNRVGGERFLPFFARSN